MRQSKKDAKRLTKRQSSDNVTERSKSSAGSSIPFDYSLELSDYEASSTRSTSSIKDNVSSRKRGRLNRRDLVAELMGVGLSEGQAALIASSVFFRGKLKRFTEVSRKSATLEGDEISLLSEEISRLKTSALLPIQTIFNFFATGEKLMKHEFHQFLQVAFAEIDNIVDNQVAKRCLASILLKRDCDILEAYCLMRKNLDCVYIDFKIANVLLGKLSALSKFRSDFSAKNVVPPFDFDVVRYLQKDMQERYFDGENYIYCDEFSVILDDMKCYLQRTFVGMFGEMFKEVNHPVLNEIWKDVAKSELKNSISLQEFESWITEDKNREMNETCNKLSDTICTAIQVIQNQMNSIITVVL